MEKYLKLKEQWQIISVGSRQDRVEKTFDTEEEARLACNTASRPHGVCDIYHSQDLDEFLNGTQKETRATGPEICSQPV